jgi:phage repressor protein C with HTH and peptisase S24 domain
MSLLLRFKVSGHSMQPTLSPGTEILVSSLPFLLRSPSEGDLIAFKDKEEFIIKRIKQVKDGKYLVQGDNPSDSREYGWIERKRIIGKVIA